VDRVKPMAPPCRLATPAKRNVEWAERGHRYESQPALFGLATPMIQQTVPLPGAATQLPSIQVSRPRPAPAPCAIRHNLIFLPAQIADWRAVLRLAQMPGRYQATEQTKMFKSSTPTRGRTVQGTPVPNERHAGATSDPPLRVEFSPNRLLPTFDQPFRKSSGR
jgi:hypothetical protein